MTRKSPAILALALMVAPSIAAAYMPAADGILSSVAARRARIGFSTIVAEGHYEQGDQRVPVWEAIKAGKARRIEYRKPAGTEVVVTTNGRRNSALADLIMTFLARSDPDPGGRQGLLFLKRHKIDELEVSLSRQQKRISYVIGAKPWETEKPQLWIDKEMLVPARLITKDDDGATLDIRLLDWGAGSTDEWYPRRIETYRNGQLAETYTYERAKLNEALAPSLFEPPS
jgi:outer membrane lipoprotein-sorting protein